jgi:hypothetical protein
MMAIGTAWLVCAIILLTETEHPDAAAVLFVFSFIFLWVPQMLPAHEKYKKVSYTGNERRRQESSGSN